MLFVHNPDALRRLWRGLGVLGIAWLMTAIWPESAASTTGLPEPVSRRCAPLSRPPAVQLYRDPARDLVHATLRTPDQSGPSAGCPSPLPFRVPPGYRPPFPVWRDVTGQVLRADGSRDPTYPDPYPFRVWIQPDGTMRHDPAPGLAAGRSLAYRLNLSWGTTLAANDHVILVLLDTAGVRMRTDTERAHETGALGFEVPVPLPVSGLPPCGNEENVHLVPLEPIPPWYRNCQNEAGRVVRLELDARSIKDRERMPSEIGQLEALERLQIFNYTGTVLFPELGQLRQLEHLVLNHNQFTALPPAIGRLARLEHLDLSHNRLSALPSEVGRLHRLEHLDLSFNQLAALTPEVGRLRRLKRLDLSSNQLTALPPEVGRLHRLEGLRLHYNQLTNLPPEVGRLHGLERLSLNNNRLAVLPPEIGQLTFPVQSWAWYDPFLHPMYYDPAHLDLSHNRLTTLPTEVDQLMLFSLDLSHNQFTALPTEVLGIGLARLNLSHNRLTTLPPEIGQLGAIQVLDLSHNQLNTLPPEIGLLSFPGHGTKMGLIQNTLDLSHNRLTGLPPEFGLITFAEGNPANTLDLSHNQFTDLPPEVGQFTWLLVNLRHNPISDPCRPQDWTDHALWLRIADNPDLDHLCPD